jgi:5,5'-dehydrodivanillate O-demethylase
VGGGIRAGAYPTREFLGLIYAFFGEGEPPAFPPYPAFEGEGIVETYATIFPNNYFQSWENDWDAFHARFTHQTGESHELDFEATLTSERYEETDYGVVRTMDVGGGRINTAILVMPATTQVMIPIFNEQARRGAERAARAVYIAHVPIDDHSHWAYVTQLARVTGAEKEDYLPRYAEAQAVNAAFASPAEIAGEILRNGIRTVRDVKDHPMLVEVEDQLAQGGQGVIANRHIEHLGRTDAGVVMLRRLFARELRALSEGRPTKAWTMSKLIPEDGWPV